MCILRVLHLAQASVYPPADETAEADVARFMTTIPAKDEHWPTAINMSDEACRCPGRRCILANYCGNEQPTDVLSDGSM